MTAAAESEFVGPIQGARFREADLIPILFSVAALAEIAGCFAFWAWWRQGASMFWLLPGAASLCLFAWMLALSFLPQAGRTYAAYGGIYIVASLLWLWWVEGLRPDRWDVTGAVMCLAGASVILLSHRAV